MIFFIFCSPFLFFNLEKYYIQKQKYVNSLALFFSLSQGI